MSKAVAPLWKWLRNAWQKRKNVFYEGPEPPKRLEAISDAFAAAHPHATRGQWLEFCKAHADEAYRSGYQRGIEWYHRDELQSHNDPEEWAEIEGHDWPWEEVIPTSAELALDAVVSDEVPENVALQEQAEYLEMRDAYQREHRLGSGPRRY